MFPCFDEPHQKTEFTLSAVVDASFLCVSNMPVVRTETVSDTKNLVVFQKTPLMSTYACFPPSCLCYSPKLMPAIPQLVSLVAGPLSRIESEETRIPISVLCPKGSEAEAKFALKIASDGLCFFEELFDSLYPLPKLDLVALSDMSSGAMEN